MNSTLEDLERQLEAQNEELVGLLALSSSLPDTSFSSDVLADLEAAFEPPAPPPVLVPVFAVRV